jgi:DNA-binding transcriptional MerR regulator/effector-binding domain-containing protein
MEESTLLPIREFSEYTGVKQTILRHYDEIGLFVPIQRGENGYRYYSPMQIVALNMVMVMSDLRTSLREIVGLERNRSPERMLEHLQTQEEKLDSELRRLQEAYTIAHTYRRLIREALEADENAVVEREIPAFSMRMGPKNSFEGTETFYKDFTAFCQYARQYKINLSYPIGGLFESMDAFLEKPSQPAYFFSLEPHGVQQKDSGRYLVAYTRGYYGAVNDVRERITAYAQEHKLECFGPVYVIYVLDEISVGDPDQYLARVCVQVKKKRIG